ncbi:MAG: hypothetical protein AAGE52_13275 [Myxococcota bacterium]
MSHRATRALVWICLLGCGGASVRTDTSDAPPAAYDRGEEIFARLREEAVILLPQHDTLEGLLVELQSTLAAYGSQGDVALQAYQEADEAPWSLRALIRAVEVYRFTAEVVAETRIMVPLDVRAEMEADPAQAESVEARFRGEVQSVLQQTAQRLRCRGRSVLQELLPQRRGEGSAGEQARADEMLVELTGVCGQLP